MRLALLLGTLLALLAASRTDDGAATANAPATNVMCPEEPCPWPK